MMYALIRMLPERCQAIRNCEDMGALLRYICGPDWSEPGVLRREPNHRDN
jgi:hypothetical protein